MPDPSIAHAVSGVTASPPSTAVAIRRDHAVRGDVDLLELRVLLALLAAHPHRVAARGDRVRRVTRELGRVPDLAGRGIDLEQPAVHAAGAGCGDPEAPARGRDQRRRRARCERDRVERRCRGDARTGRARRDVWLGGGRAGDERERERLRRRLPPRRRRQRARGFGGAGCASERLRGGEHIGGMPRLAVAGQPFQKGLQLVHRWSPVSTSSRSSRRSRRAARDAIARGGLGAAQRVGDFAVRAVLDAHEEQHRACTRAQAHEVVEIRGVDVGEFLAPAGALLAVDSAAPAAGCVRRDSDDRGAQVGEGIVERVERPNRQRAGERFQDEIVGVDADRPNGPGEAAQRGVHRLEDFGVARRAGCTHYCLRHHGRAVCDDRRAIRAASDRGGSGCSRSRRRLR